MKVKDIVENFSIAHETKCKINISKEGETIFEKRASKLTNDLENPILEEDITSIFVKENTLHILL